jgi:putative membrane protein
MERKKNIYLISAILFLLIIYTVGIVRLQHAETRAAFQKLVPYNILLSMMLLLFFHQPWNRNAIVVMLVIFLGGFQAELLGVNTGKIFGAYSYGESLGWQVVHTPVIIGLNWLLLIYTVQVTVAKFNIKPLWNSLTGAVLMTALDYLIEPVAMKFDFWQWQDGIIPIQNYVAWACISFLMLWYANRISPVKENKLATPLLLMQFLFFLILNII